MIEYHNRIVFRRKTELYPSHQPQYNLVLLIDLIELNAQTLQTWLRLKSRIVEGI
jgi:hypothetical protein